MSRLKALFAVFGVIVFLFSSVAATGSRTTTSPTRTVTTTSSTRMPSVGSRVVVTEGRGMQPTVTAKVPPAQTTGSTGGVARKPSDTVIHGTPYSPSGYTTPAGRPAIYSPNTRTYVEVHHYFYSDWPMFYGYYGCLYCFSGPYSFAPIPFVPTAATQPVWAFDGEAIILLILFTIGLFATAGWVVRRDSYYYY